MDLQCKPVVPVWKREGGGEKIWENFASNKLYALLYIMTGGWRMTPWWTTLSQTGTRVSQEGAIERSAWGCIMNPRMEHGLTMTATHSGLPYAPNALRLRPLPPPTTTPAHSATSASP